MKATIKSDESNVDVDGKCQASGQFGSEGSIIFNEDLQGNLYCNCFFEIAYI